MYTQDDASDGTAPGAWYRDTLVWQILVGIISAAPFVALSFLCLTTWLEPLRWGTDTVHYLIVLMLTEFLVITASVFMTLFAASDVSTIRKILWIGVFGGVYVIFGACWSVILKTIAPIATMTGLLASRFIFVLFSGKLGQRETRHQMMVLNVGCSAYVLLACAISMPMNLPRFGMTAELIANLHLPHHGLWISEPHRVAAFGFAYFLILAIVEILYGPVTFLKEHRLSKVKSPSVPSR